MDDTIVGVHDRKTTEEQERDAKLLEQRRKEQADAPLVAESYWGPKASERDWVPPQGTAVYAAPFESAPGQSSDRTTVTDNTGPVLGAPQDAKAIKRAIADVLDADPEVFDGMTVDQVWEQLKQWIAGQLPVQEVTDEGQLELYKEDVQTTPHPAAPERLNKTIRKTNLPGGFLMNTREFEQWVLENFIPMQDRISMVAGAVDTLLQSEAQEAVGPEVATLQDEVATMRVEMEKLKGGLRAANSRVTALDAVVRDLKEKLGE